MKFPPNQVTFCILVRRFKPFSTSSEADRASEPFEVLIPPLDSLNYSDKFEHVRTLRVRFDQVRSRPCTSLTETRYVAYREWNFIPSAFYRGNYMDKYKQKNIRMHFFNQHKFFISLNYYMHQHYINVILTRP